MIIVSHLVSLKDRPIEKKITMKVQRTEAIQNQLRNIETFFSGPLDVASLLECYFASFVSIIGLPRILYNFRGLTMAEESNKITLHLNDSRVF